MAAGLGFFVIIMDEAERIYGIHGFARNKKSRYEDKQIREKALHDVVVLLLES